MLAYVVVLNTPYFTTVSLLNTPDGNKLYCPYSIANVPPGSYWLKIWNLKLKAAELKIAIHPKSTLTQDVILGKK